MPEPDDSGIVDLDQHQKDKDEFDATTEAILNAEEGTSDEDIIKSMDKPAEEKDDKTGTAGEATKDPIESTDGMLSEDDAKKFATDDGVAHLDNSTNADNDKLDPKDAGYWKAKYEASEAILKKEQQKTSSWDGRIRAANEKVKVLEQETQTLREQLEAKTIDPDKESDTEVLDRFRKDFPELAEVVNVLEKRITKTQPPQAKVPESTVTNTEGNSGHSTVADEVKTDTTHMDDIHKAHPDLSEMVSTGVLLTWIHKQKPYIKPTLENIYYKGSAQSVVDLCTQFKDSTGWKSQLANDDVAKEAAKAKKLADLAEVNSESAGAPAGGPDKNDFAGAFKEAVAADKK
jgi:hypothetical protein